jgi:hypothetical protein
MANKRLFDYNEWDYLSLESSSAEIAWPNTNTQTRWKTQTWKATGDTSEYVRSTGASAIEIYAAFVWNGNVTASGTVTLKGSDDNWGTTPTSEAMTRSTDGTLYVHVFASGTTRDDWGIYVADATNPDAYVSLGRVWMGAYYEPDIGVDPDSTKKVINETVELESTGGQVSLLEKPDFLRFPWVFGGIKNKTRYDTLISRVGNKSAFVILEKPKGYIGNDYPNPEDNSYYVRLKKHDEKPIAGDYHRAIWTLQEER